MKCPNCKGELMNNCPRCGKPLKGSNLMCSVPEIALKIHCVNCYFDKK